MLCRDLRERALVTWTAAELARILACRAIRRRARQVLTDPTARLADGEPGSSTALLTAEMPGGARRGRRAHGPRQGGARDRDRAGPGGVANLRAAQIWWAGRLFGSEAAGGDDVVHEAQRPARTPPWMQALREPDLAADLRR